MARSLWLAALLTCATAFASAQEAKKPAPKSPARKKAAATLAPVADLPGLPRVLLIGDSISMGYTLPTRARLKGVANVHRPPTNCGPSSRGVADLNKWLGTGTWDVIHFNFGLHDLKHVDASGKNTAPNKGPQQVPLPEYKKNLETIVARLKKTGAKLIFATTTPVPGKEPQRVADSDIAYNAAALEVMKANGVAVNDLNAFVRSRKGEGQLPNNVHFTPEGSHALAEQVAAEVKKALGK